MTSSQPGKTNMEIGEMADIKALEDQITKTKAILAESRDNLAQNPNDYSAQLLLMSVENHLADLLRQLESKKNA